MNKLFMLGWSGLVLVLLITAGCTSAGPSATQSVTEVDRQYIDQVLAKLKMGISKEEVAQAIKQEYADDIMRMTWHPQHTGRQSRVTAYFYKDKLYKLQWLKLTGIMTYAVIYQNMDESFNYRR